MGEDTIYSASFLQYLGFAAQVPNVVFNWLNIFVQIGYGVESGDAAAVSLFSFV